MTNSALSGISFGVVMFLFRLVTLVLFLFSLSRAEADQRVTAEILQFRSGRLYFDAGEDENIIKGLRFSVVCNDTARANGIIEASFPGLSYGTILPFQKSDRDWTDCKALIERAVVDSTSFVRIGTDIPIARLLGFPDVNPGQAASPDAILPVIQMDEDNSLLSNGRMRLIPYESRLEMQFDFSSGTIDGYLSYQEILQGITQEGTEKIKAPYLVALVPNLSSRIYNGGMLTTALFYRIDQSNLSLYFQGDDLEFISSWHTNDASRIFPFDPIRSDQLLRQVAVQSRTVSLFSSESDLDPLVSFFSDILSRLNLRASNVSDARKADFRVEMIPSDPDDPLVSIAFLLSELSRDTLSGSSAAETIRLLSSRLASCRQATDSKSYVRYLSRINLALLDDLGVFPLFQPTLFLQLRENVHGVTLSEPGRIELNSPRMLHLPQQGDSK